MMKNTSIFLQRQIEARILKQVIDGLSLQFNKEEILNNIKGTIEQIAFEKGKALRYRKNKNPFEALAEFWEELAEDNSLEIDKLEVSESRLTFRVTKCKYAEFYEKIGAAELGPVLSCCRDSAFLEGFSECIKLKRSKTIMEDNPVCDFIYELKSTAGK